MKQDEYLPMRTGFGRNEKQVRKEGDYENDQRIIYKCMNYQRIKTHKV